MLAFPAGVLTTRWISPFLMASAMLGRPSCTFRIGAAATPFDSRNFLVPSVATMENPSSAKRRAASSAPARSRSETVMRTVPCSGRSCPAATCALKKASP